MKRTLFFLLLLGITLPAFSQHTLVLKSGDKVKGVVMSIQDDELTMAVNRELNTYHMKDVSSIFFNEYVPYDGSFSDDIPEQTMRSGDYLIKYQMKDRKMTVAPKISNATENRGVVVVEVVISRTGTVMKAEPGMPGSTTSSEYLYTKAKFAAMGAHFNEHPKGPIETTGTITITY